jgi:alpha-methylacyl-CoA racemase
MAAVSGRLAGLLESRATGRGRHVKIALAQAIHSWLAIPLGSWAADGQDPAPRSRWWNGAHPFYRLYETADGKHLAVGALEKGFSLSLLDALGLGKLKALADDPMRNSESLVAALSGVFASASLEDWERRLEGKDVCVTPLLTLSAAARLWSRSVRRARRGRA